jgi:protein-disulfide isomerase
MSRYPLLPLLAAGAIALSACGAKSAGKSDAAFDAKVHAYLIAHPEVVQEALTALQAKQDAADAAVAKLAINKQRAAIEHDARDFVANPNGKITVTEFYDYRCPHCINAAPAVLELIQKNPDVRFVFKEFPIFGKESDLAAQGAVAVKRAGGDYLAVYRELMATKALDDAAIYRILAAHGVTAAELEKADNKAAIDTQIADIRHLAIGLGIQGTPAFIIGDTMVPGEMMDDVKAAITAERKKVG